MEPAPGRGRARRRRTRRSRPLPPDLSLLLNSLIKHAASFIQMFDQHELLMRRTVGEFEKVADRVRALQDRTNSRYGPAAGGAGLLLCVVGVFAAQVAGGTGSAVVAAVTGAAVFGGAAGFSVATNRFKSFSEAQSENQVRELGEELMKTVEPLKKDVEEMQQTYRKVELTAGAQAEHALREVEEFQRIHRRLSEQGPRRTGGLRGAGAVLELIGGLITGTVSVLRVTTTNHNHKKFLDCIIQSADQGQRVMGALCRMKEELKTLQIDKMMEEEGSH